MDAGLREPAARPSPIAPLWFESVEDAIAVRVDVPVGRVARALLVALGRAEGDPVTVIGVRGGHTA